LRVHFGPVLINELPFVRSFVFFLRRHDSVASFALVHYLFIPSELGFGISEPFFLRHRKYHFGDLGARKVLTFHTTPAYPWTLFGRGEIGCIMEWLVQELQDTHLRNCFLITFVAL
jgi:hypothetical protein